MSREGRLLSETLLFDIFHDIGHRVCAPPRLPLHGVTTAYAVTPTPPELSQIYQRPSDTVMDVRQGSLRSDSRANIGGWTTGVNRLIFIQILMLRELSSRVHGWPDVAIPGQRSHALSHTRKGGTDCGPRWAIISANQTSASTGAYSSTSIDGARYSQ